MVHAFRFGIIIPLCTEWITKGRQAEDPDYTTLLVPDHITGTMALCKPPG